MAMEGPPPPSASAPTGPIYNYVTAAQQLLAMPNAVTLAAAGTRVPTYNGGYVQKRPYVHVIFWGSEWNEKAGTKEKLLALYRTINGGGYGKLLSQYFDETGYISGEVDLTSYTDTSTAGPTTVPNQGEVKAEVERSINSQGWAKSYENQYVVFTPPGTPVPSPQLFCGYHSWGGGEYEMSYTYVPWASTYCARGLEPWASMQVSSSHEFSESETDPIPEENYWGWVASIQGGEISDLCNTQEPSERQEIAGGVWAAKDADDFETARNGVQCSVNDSSPGRFEVHVGQSNVGLHQATLTGLVESAGWPGYYDFEFEGPGGTTTIPARKGNQLEFYGFASAGSELSPVPVSTQVNGLRGNTTYSVRLQATGKLTTPSVAEKGPIPIVFGGGQTQFTTPDWRPVVTTGAATEVKAHTAVLSGSVNPQGEDTHYQFEYGATTAYGSQVPVPAADVGSGAGAVTAENALSGLEEATVYHYRISASNGEGTAYGADREFRTPGKPVVTSTAPLYTNTFEPRATGTVIPNGAATTFQVEYGKTTKYGSRVPVTAQGIGSGLAPVAVGEYLEGLERNTAYHYRLTATNEVGTVIGGDESFTTLPLCKGTGGACSWKEMTSLSPVPPASDSVVGASCPTTSMCMAVGNNARTEKGFASVWNGSSWSSIPLENWTHELQGVSCPTASYCIIIEKGTTRTWELKRYEIPGGELWYPEARVASLPVGTTEVQLHSVSCVTTTNCTAVGSDLENGSQRLFSLAWNGTQWSYAAAARPENGNTSRYMLGVSCPTAGVCVSVGTYEGRPVAEVKGSAWSLSPAISMPAGAKTGELEAISCVSATACTAVGTFTESSGASRALVEGWNGTNWSPGSSPVQEAGVHANLASVSCSAALTCVASGQLTNEHAIEGSLLVDTISGGTASQQTVPALSERHWVLFNGVSCPTSSRCEAVGAAREAAVGSGTEYETVIDGWNGTSWSRQTSINPEPRQPLDHFESVSCASASTCLAVGVNANSSRGLLQSWSGGPTWTKPFLESWNHQLRGISCPSSTACMVVEKAFDGTVELKWDELPGGAHEHIWGPEQRAAPTPPGATEINLQGISCSSEVACTAVGSYLVGTTYEPFALRWNGSSWTQQSGVPPAEGTSKEAMMSVSCPAATFCMSVGLSATGAAAEQWNGSTWQAINPGNPPGTAHPKFLSVSCVSATFCAAAGSVSEGGRQRGLVETWNGSGWSRASLPNPEEKSQSGLNGVSCLSPRSCTAVGEYFSEATGITRPLVESLTKTTWTLQTAPAPRTWTPLSSVSCTSAIACVAVGNERLGLPETDEETFATIYE